MILPGFTNDDGQGDFLERLLGELGYDVHGWGLGRNDGPSPELDEALLAIPDRFEEPVSLIGVSLGGVYARGIARERPDRVRRVITLGSPHQSPRRFRPTRVLPPVADRDLGPVPVPSTAIVARFDQIVRPEHAVLDGDPRAETITITGGHCGMARNPLMMRAIVLRLRRD